MFKKLTAPFCIGYRLRDKVALFYLTFLFTARRRLGLLNVRPYRIEVKKAGNHAEFFVTDGSDMGVLREVFGGEEYTLHIAFLPKVIFDIGSNVGVSIVFFKLQYPDARIVGFEPDPFTFEKLKRNTAQFADVKVFQCALSDKEGFTDFFVNEKSSMSSSLYARLPGQRVIKIPSRTIQGVIRDEGLELVDVVKFDVEGAEFSIFLPHVIDSLPVSHIIGEVHEDIAHKSVDVFLSLFRGWHVIRKYRLFSHRYVVELSRDKV